VEEIDDSYCEEGRTAEVENRSCREAFPFRGEEEDLCSLVRGRSTKELGIDVGGHHSSCRLGGLGWKGEEGPKADVRRGEGSNGLWHRLSEGESMPENPEQEGVEVVGSRRERSNERDT
jgi:hypothetical protein